eukprot:609591-Prorocentrum_minimum.AAC.3
MHLERGLPLPALVARHQRRGARLRRGGRPGGLMMRVPRGRPSVRAAAGTLVERGNFKAVSYTHLTLPTILLV